MNYAEQLRANLRTIRDEGICSAEQMASYAGVTIDTIQKFLSKNPAIQTKDLGGGKAKALAKGLGMSLDELYEQPIKIPAESA